jgi:antitoxin VapB
MSASIYRIVYTLGGERCTKMEIAKVFRSGNSQAVRLPKEFRLREDRVYVRRLGDAILLLPYGDPWRSLLNGLDLFSDDFMVTRELGEVEEREHPFE